MRTPIRIMQAELKEVSDLERELAWKEQRLKDIKENLLVLLREGVPIEPGRFDARLATRVGRPVPWKQLFVERLGQFQADMLKRQFKTHVYFEVEVVEHAVPPLWQAGAGETGAQS